MGAGALALAGGAFRWFAVGYAAQLTADEVPIGLSTKELAIAKAVVETLLPADGDFPSGVSLGVHQRIDEEAWASPEATQNDLKNGLELLEHATVAYGYGARFTSLGQADREAYLAALLDGKSTVLRQVSFGIKQMAHLFYYAHPEVWKVIGYEGPFVGDAVPPDSHVVYGSLLKRKGEA